MQCRVPIFALLAAAMTFAAAGVDITVNASVDSQIESVGLTAGNQSMNLSRNGSATWTGKTGDTIPLSFSSRNCMPLFSIFSRL